MKKSRIFIFAVLAFGISKAIIAKTHNRAVLYKYFNDAIPSVCVQGIFETDPCPSGIAIDCTTDIRGFTKQLYTDTCLGFHEVKRNP